MKFAHGLRAIGVILGVVLLGAPDLVYAQNLTQGQIQALIVAGEVKVAPGGNGPFVALKRNDYVKVGDVVIAYKDGTALLAFANGAIMKVMPNSQIGVTKFEQMKFDATAMGQMLNWTKEPSQSVTELDCRNGTVTIVVKPLNAAAGSKFSVDSPVGSFSATDGLFSVAVVRNAGGQVQKLLGNSYVGTITFSPVVALANHPSAPTANRIEIPAGGQMQVRLTTESSSPSATSQVFGAGIPPKYSQDAIIGLYAATNVSRASSLAPPPPPAAPAPTPPPGLPVAEFDANVPSADTVVDVSTAH